MGDLTPWDDLFPKQNIDTNSESEPDGMFDSFVHTLINPARKARLWTLACYPLIFLLGLPWWWHTTSVERLDLPLAGVNGMAEGVVSLDPDSESESESDKGDKRRQDSLTL